MLDKYVEIIDKIKEEMLFLIIGEDENGKDLFVMVKDFMRFRFKANDNLVYNKKNNIPVCVISISSVLNKRDWYYFQTGLQECFGEN